MVQLASQFLDFNWELWENWARSKCLNKDVPWSSQVFIEKEKKEKNNSIIFFSFEGWLLLVSCVPLLFMILVIRNIITSHLRHTLSKVDIRLAAFQANRIDSVKYNSEKLMCLLVLRLGFIWLYYPVLVLH